MVYDDFILRYNFKIIIMHTLFINFLLNMGFFNINAQIDEILSTLNKSLAVSLQLSLILLILERCHLSIIIGYSLNSDIGFYFLN